jgi:hypothetical protein
MSESTEQCICIKFCYKIRKTATEVYQVLLQEYGEGAIGRTQVLGCVDLKGVEPLLQAIPAWDGSQHQETRK